MKNTKYYSVESEFIKDFCINLLIFHVEKFFMTHLSLNYDSVILAHQKDPWSCK